VRDKKRKSEGDRKKKFEPKEMSRERLQKTAFGKEEKGITGKNHGQNQKDLHKFY